MRGITLVSGILFLAITVVATAIVYQAAVPVINKLQAAATIERMKETFSELDAIVREVASQGNGSRRTLSIRVDPGTFVVNDSTDAITWTYETEAPVISPRTFQDVGNLRIGANLETTVNETTLWGNKSYLLENERLRAYFNRTGNSTNPVTVRTDQILLALYNKDTGEWLHNPGFLEISIDSSSASTSGQGYVTSPLLGSYLPYGTVVAVVNSSYLNYTITFTLESGADFLTIEGDDT